MGKRLEKRLRVRSLLAASSIFAAAALAQTPPATPYRQCPAIGSSSSCGVLIVVNANNTVSVYKDPKIPAYENSDDTLTGFLNNSSQTIASLPLKSGTDIFGFEDDGICSKSITPKPGGCPFGPTGYEGPGVSYSNISSDKHSGTVNFSPGIPPGGSAYFGLEEALSASDVTVPLNTTCPASSATSGVAYSSQLNGTGGNGKYTWSLVTQGSLGTFTLSVSPSGLVTGTPDTAGQLNLTIKISDGAGATAQQACSIAVTAFADLVIVRVEAVQVIHGSSVPLISGKSTVVRVFVRALGKNVSPVANVSAVLHGLSAPDPLLPFTPPITALVYNGPLPYNNPPNYEEQTIDFVLPDDWVSTSGVFGMEAELVPPPNYKDPDTSNNTSPFNLVLFTPPSNPASSTPGKFNVGYIAICLQAPGTQKQCPSAGAGNLTQFVNKLYPVTSAGFQFSRAGRLRNPYARPIPNTNTHNEQAGWMTDLLGALRRYFERSAFYLDMDFLVGFLPDVPGIPYGGLADALWAGGGGGVVLVVDYSARTAGYTAETLAHELGHNIGLRHVNQNMPAACTSIAVDPCTTWPYKDPTIQNAGYDVLNRKVIPAKTNFDMMSYCADYTASNTWISPAYYTSLFDNNLSTSLSPVNRSCAPAPSLTILQRPQRSVGRAISAAPQDYLLVSGTAARDGSTGQLNPAFKVSTRLAPPAGDPSGNYCVRFFGNGGALGTHCFTLNFTNIESGSLLDQTSFSFLVAAPQGVTRIALLSGSRELASISGGAQPPALSITAPRAGDRWDAASAQNLVWSGSGASALTYIVDYSYDGGTTWVPLSTEIADSNLAIAPAEITGGSNVFFRVQASDGLNTASAQVGPITVVQSAAITATPASVDFRNALPGQGVQRQVVLTNSGSGPLRVTGASATDAAFKVISPAVPFNIQAGDSVTLTLQFSPLLTGQKVATLTITSNAAGSSTLSIPLRGNGIATTAPDAAVSLTSIDFGTVPVGGSKTQNVTLQNFGPAPVQVSSVTVTGSSFIATGVSGGLTLSANGVNTIAVQFAPQQAGSQTGSIAIASNDPAQPSITISLQGQGASPGPAAPLARVSAGGVVSAASSAAPISPGEVASLYGTDLSGSAASASSVPLPTTLAGVQVLVGGVAAPLFYVSPTLINFQSPFEAIVGTTQVVVVRDGVTGQGASVTVAAYAPEVFRYLRSGAILDPVVVHTDNSLVTPNRPAAPNEVLIAYMTGIGPVQNTPATGQASPFSPLATPATTPVATLGGSPITVLFAGLTPGGVGLAQLNFQLGASLPSGACAPLVVRAGGVASQPVNLALGPGNCGPIAPAIAVSPTSLSFGNVNTGQTKTLTLAVQNTGGAALTIASMTSDNARFSATAPSTPVQVSAGSQQQVTVQFAPTAAGAQSGTLTIASNDPAKPSVTIALTGTGTTGQTSSVVLQVDGGTFTQSTGFPEGQAGAAFVNRLTPTSYPATLQNVQIYFGNRTTGLPVNTPITVIFGPNPSGSSDFSATLTSMPTKVGATGVFNTYSVTPVTINTGDFIVGFVVDNPVGLYPADLDITTASKQRSFYAVGNFSFTLLDSAGLAGNLGIRAAVTQ